MNTANKKTTDISPEKLFQEIAAFITQSQKLLEQDAILELAGLDDRVQVLCDAMAKLSGEDRKLHAVRLQEIFDSLTGLGNAMVAHRDAIASGIRDVAVHRKASVAYRIADATDNFGKKDENE